MADPDKRRAVLLSIPTQTAVKGLRAVAKNSHAALQCDDIFEIDFEHF
jgi:hypothetical protein